MDDSLKTLPKAEVHVHLEGSLDIDEVVALAQSAGTSLPRPRNQLLAFSGLTISCISLIGCAASTRRRIRSPRRLILCSTHTCEFRRNPAGDSDFDVGHRSDLIPAT